MFTHHPWKIYSTPNASKIRHHKVFFWQKTQISFWSLRHLLSNFLAAKSTADPQGMLILPSPQLWSITEAIKRGSKGGQNGHKFWHQIAALISRCCPLFTFLAIFWMISSTHGNGPPHLLPLLGAAFYSQLFYKLVMFLCWQHVYWWSACWWMTFE